MIKTQSGEWEFEYDGYVFTINELQIKDYSKGRNNPKVTDLKVIEDYQFTTTQGKKADVEFEIELPQELQGETVTVTSKKDDSLKGTVDGKYDSTTKKYIGTITTDGQNNPNGTYEYEIKVTKNGEDHKTTVIAIVNKFLDDPTIEVADIKYNEFTVKVTNNYPTDAGLQYKYYYSTTTTYQANETFETATSKVITGLNPETEYNVKVGVYLNDKSDYKEITTTAKTLEKMIEIHTIEDLETIKNDLTGNYKLMNDLDFKQESSYKTEDKYKYYNQDNDNDGNLDNSWIPIGTNSTPFKGKFDGQYYKIKNLYINTTNYNVGLFGYVEKSEIKNLTMENSNIECLCVAGGILGYGIDVKVDNCKFLGLVKTSSYTTQAACAFTGGIAGRVNGDLSEITNCINEGEITGLYAHVGGIVGNIQSGKISDCINDGNVIGGNSYIGGITGSFGAGGIFRKMYSLWSGMQKCW